MAGASHITAIGQKREFHSLTALRGIAATLVVIFHFSGGFLPSLQLERYTAFFRQGYLWVDFFFLLSGFVLTHAYGKTFSNRFDWSRARTFAIGRLARLYPLHLTILTMFLALEFVKLILHNAGHLNDAPFVNGNTLDNFLANIALIQTLGFIDTPGWNGPAWSIGAEWIAYLLFPILALCLLNLSRLWMGLALIASFSGLAWISFRLGHIDVTYDLGLLRCLLEFSAGIVLYRLVSLRHPGWWSSDGAVLTLLAATVASMHFNVWDALIPVLMALSIVSLAGNNGYINHAFSRQPMIWLGTISYSIYMSHLLVLRTFELIANTLVSPSAVRHFDAIDSLALLVLLLGIVLALSHALYHCVEDPARRAIRRRFIEPGTQKQACSSPGNASTH
ncbi:acyltransferase [Halomonas sp. McH1-25]|uniref:acyltransferase family protein n=1 Tax=unclassified Halomonas TaxID=2609666 RepID=UPI001EF70EE6|nr:MULTISPECIES: acyltransferase [unclassified Halomonas]MCG7600598.1 acyltransferase [Halomonas sp. McH1-25]MCP1343221.1 acyltransferase [Halomonas sp. FL8]MCP1359917.1 acyltransferase [Halomonas sp. BBD45]MCP1366599.1 acyltransferase [Halomonas sp. BBD48]